MRITLLAAVIEVVFCVSVHAQETEWLHQVATGGPLAISADGLGNIYVSGVADYDPFGGGSKGFLEKYTDNGDFLWAHKFGDSELVNAISVSADKLGNVFVVGQNPESVNGDNRLNLNKYDQSGVLVWAREYGQPALGSAVVADGFGNAYLAGSSSVPLFGTQSGILLLKVDSSGNALWETQSGPQSNSKYIAIDGLGGVYVSGVTSGNLAGINAGHFDGFVRKYDVSGNVLWTKQFGTADYEDNTCVAADALGNVFIAGSTYQPGEVSRF